MRTLAWLLLPLFSAAQPATLEPLAAEQVHTRALHAEVSLRSVVVSWQLQCPRLAPQFGLLRLERSSTGIDWAPVTCFPYRLTPRLVRPFRWKDPLLPGIRYYRLVWESAEAELELAQTYFDNPGGVEPLSARPDFARNRVAVHYAPPPAGKSLLVRLYNHIGVQLEASALPPTTGIGSYEFNFEPYPEGVYLVVITQVEDNLDIADHRIEWYRPG